MNLNLDSTQVDLLREILDSTFRDLRYEVSATDNSEYKQQLRERERALARCSTSWEGRFPIGDAMTFGPIVGHSGPVRCWYASSGLDRTRGTEGRADAGNWRRGGENGMSRN